jgi:hypothetical protein
MFKEPSIKTLLSILMIIDILATSAGIINGMSTKEVSYVLICIYGIWMILSLVYIDICRKMTVANGRT